MSAEMSSLGDGLRRADTRGDFAEDENVELNEDRELLEFTPVELPLQVQLHVPASAPFSCTASAPVCPSGAPRILYLLFGLQLLTCAC